MKPIQLNSIYNVVQVVPEKVWMLLSNQWVRNRLKQVLVSNSSKIVKVVLACCFHTMVVWSQANRTLFQQYFKLFSSSKQIYPNLSSSDVTVHNNRFGLNGSMENTVAIYPHNRIFNHNLKLSNLCYQKHTSLLEIFASRFCVRSLKFVPLSTTPWYYSSPERYSNSLQQRVVNLTHRESC